MHYRETVKRALLGIFGTLLGLLGLGALAAGAGVLAVFGMDGVARVGLGEVRADKGRAVVVNDFQIEAPVPVPIQEGWLDLELEVLGEQSHFVGVAPKPDALKYLRGVPYEIVNSVDTTEGELQSTRIPGDAKPSPPQSEQFWTDQQTGTDVVVAWPVSATDTTLVVMNEDSSAGVAAQIDVRVGVSWAVPVGIGLAIAGLIAVGLGIWMLAAAMKPKESEYDWPAPGAGQG